MAAYLLTSRAARDLREIEAYLSREASNTIAIRYSGHFFSTFELLAGFPGIGHIRPDLSSRPVLFWYVQPYMVVYEKRLDHVVIHAVIHGARDVKTILSRLL